MSARTKNVTSPAAKPRKAAAAKKPAGAIKSAELAQLGAMGKAFSILEIISANKAPLPMSELVRASGLTKPTAHRITGVLADMGFIERDMLNRGYIEGPRLIKLALDTLAASAPRNMRHAVLRAVSESVGETCNFGILASSEVIYLDRVESKWPLGLRFEAGSRVPVHCTALGKLLVAQLPPTERRQAISAMPLTRYTSRTITDIDKLTAAIEAIGKSGVGIDDQEFIEGVVCVSVPVKAANGQVVGGLAISAPEARVSVEQLRKFVPAMREAARQYGATYQFSLGG